ncbi:radical SAM protein [Streptomyces sp. INA 01156]
MVRHAKEELGQRVEICTNGYRIERRLTEIAPHLDLLRVSLEGVGPTNDGIRRQGSYRSALNSLGLARDLGVPTGATMTVTSRNIDEVLPLAGVLAQLGSGNSAPPPAGDRQRRRPPRTVGHRRLRLRSAPRRARVGRPASGGDRRRGPVRARRPQVCAPSGGPREIDRIEADPRGALTMSCKAVGKDSHAFGYEKATGRIIHKPSATDELALAVPDVVYARA